MLDGKEFGEEVVALVKGYVERAVAPLMARNADLEQRLARLEERPAPERGEKGEPGENGLNGTDGKDGADGKDAAGIVEALKDSGELVLTLQDGRLVRTGIRDGEKGIDGKDGRDGFGFDDMDACVLDDDRTIELSFRRGEEEKAFTFKWPTMIYRGVWRAADGEYKHSYSPGDSVTWGGSLWVAEQVTNAKPDAADSGWKLACRKGRDGKDAKHG